MKRQIGIIHPDKSPEEVDDMITRGEVTNMLEGNIMQDKREHSEAAMALVHLKEQHRDIMILEQSIVELHQIFVDIATLVEAQDALVDQIEWNCEQASAWTGEATKELKTANLYVKGHRKVHFECLFSFLFKSFGSHRDVVVVVRVAKPCVAHVVGESQSAVMSCNIINFICIRMYICLKE